MMMQWSHKVRKVASYVKTKYRHRAPNGTEMNYPMMLKCAGTLTAYADRFYSVSSSPRYFLGMKLTIFLRVAMLPIKTVRSEFSVS